MKRAALALSTVLAASALVVFLVRWVRDTPVKGREPTRSRDTQTAEVTPRLPSGEGELRTPGAKDAVPAAHPIPGIVEGDGAKPAPAPPGTADPSALPRSLRGTDVDGELATDGGGRLVITRETRAFFDYFLSASGEEPLPLLRARIVRAVEARLAAAGAAEAVALLDRYLLYRERVRGVLDADGRAADPELRFRQLRELRRQILGQDAAEAFFGDEEKRDLFALEARRIRAESEGAERGRLLRELENELPRESRRARAEVTAPLRALEEERALRKSGVSGEDLRRERERRWGEDVARRLEELEKARAQWDRRLADFRQSRATLLRDPSLGPEERSSAIAALLSRDFTPEEQLRVLALDRLQGEGPGRPPEGP